MPLSPAQSAALRRDRHLVDLHHSVALLGMVTAETLYTGDTPARLDPEFVQAVEKRTPSQGCPGAAGVRCSATCRAVSGRSGTVRLAARSRPAPRQGLDLRGRGVVVLVPGQLLLDGRAVCREERRVPGHRAVGPGWQAQGRARTLVLSVAGRSAQ